MFVFNDINKNDLVNFFNKINYLHLKSEYHKEYFNNYFENKIDNSKLIIIPNGIRIDDFSLNKYNVIRNPKRFCFCSSYDRSLIEILKYIWPLIYNADNQCELHLYYGMDYIYDNDFKNNMYMLIGSTKGVMDHGRQSVDAIIREKYLSTFHLYLCNSEAEIDCINVRESLVCNCIPIITDFGVFRERHGLQYNINNNLSEDTCKIIANDIIQKMQNNNFIESARLELSNSSTIISWNNIANQWLKLFSQ
jgi:glycosyltransferase involved in cell wall biosynthesis